MDCINNNNNFTSTALYTVIFKTVWESVVFFLVGQHWKLESKLSQQNTDTGYSKSVINNNLTSLIVNTPKSFTTLPYAYLHMGQNHKNTTKVEGTHYPNYMSGSKPLFMSYSHNRPRELLAHFSLICPTT